MRVKARFPDTIALKKFLHSNVHTANVKREKTRILSRLTRPRK